MTRWQDHARTMLSTVLARGIPLDAAWREALLSVPRHAFVPRFHVDTAEGRLAGTVGEDDPGWLAEAYADEPLVTRRRSVPRPGGGREYVATSSSSQPAVVAIMLDRLAVEPGVRVLEIGTGTGYNAALLATRLGDDAVASVDLDPELVEQAADRLAALGLHPLLAAGDGALGLPGAAPFDRIVVTCAVDDVPAAWIEQLAPGGRLVAPLVEGGALAVLTKTGEDRLDGRIDDEVVFFMPLRHSLDSDTTERHLWRRAAPAPAGPPVLPPELLADLDFRLWLSLTVRHVQFVYAPDRPPVPTGRADEPLDAGALAESLRAYEEAGRPARTRYRLTVTPGGGWVALDGTSYRWPLPL